MAGVARSGQQQTLRVRTALTRVARGVAGGMLGLACVGAAMADPLPGAAPWPPELQARVASAASGTDGPPYTNALLLSASPYLRRHAHNPVDWREHDAAAFEEARRRGRPLFVSLGYAACHWCEVMELESYRDPEVAEVLNRGFVSVKVDREAQPEIAESYAQTVAAMGETVGWPLHVFLLPDGTPFHGATYLPRRDRPGRPGILTVLASVSESVERAGASLARRGEALRAELRRSLVALRPPGDGAPQAESLRAFEAAARAELDGAWGGRRSLPKRSAEAHSRALLRIARRGDEEVSRELALRGLRKMADAAVRSADGGFHEGAGDRRWSRPLSALRLADNARLALAYLEASQVTGEEGLRAVAEAALDFAIVRLSAPGGAFYASLTRGTDEDRVDAQVVAAANGLAISALARVGFAAERADFVVRAREAARFVLREMIDADGLHRVQGGGRLGDAAGLADYALLVAGLLDLFEADPDPAWIRAALRLQAEQDALFGDAEGGYWLTRDAPVPGWVRPRHARDAGLPAGNAIAAMNLLRLHALTAEERYLARCLSLFAQFRGALLEDPLAHATLAMALDAYLDGLHEIVLVAPRESGMGDMLQPLRGRFVPNRVLLRLAGDGRAEEALSLLRLGVGKRPIADRATAYVCRRQVCASPARTPAEFEAQLLRFNPL